MQVLTARARRLDNGEWIIGCPFETWNYRRTERVTYLALDNPYEVHADGAIMNLRAVMIDPDTLGYETGKKDKNGNMIYGGMKVRICEDGESRVVTVKLPDGGDNLIVEGYRPRLNGFVSSQLEIVGEERGLGKVFVTHLRM